MHLESSRAPASKSEYLLEVVYAQAAFPASRLERELIMLLAENSQRELADEIQIARRKVLSRTTSIFPKSRIQLPM